MSKQKLLRWCLVIQITWLMVFLISCTLERDLPDRNPLSDLACAPPCWQGIVPGETSRAEALEIVRSNPYVRAGSLKEAGTDNWGGALWQWKKDGRRLQPSMSWENDIVTEITLGLTYSLSVEQVIAEFGPPEMVKAGTGGVPEYQYWIVNLYYPERGLQLRAYITPQFSIGPEPSIRIEPSTPVEVAIYFRQTSISERIADEYGYVSSDVMPMLRPWKGYGDLFEVYYDSPRDLILRK